MNDKIPSNRPTTHRRIGSFAALSVALAVACSSESSQSTSDFPVGKTADDGGPTDQGANDDPGSGGTFDSDADASTGTTASESAIDLDKIAPCDDGLSVNGDVDAFLKAIGLCQRASEGDRRWGVVSASFTKGFDTTEPLKNEPQHGILPKFGSAIRPREGKNLGVLSTGFAREFNNATGAPGLSNFYSGTMWDGLIPTSKEGRNDAVALRLRIRVPSNAKSFAFDFNFYSAEWPIYVGSRYNDEFRVNLDGKNIAFGANNNPVNVNLGFFDRCTPGITLGDCKNKSPISTCPGGTDELKGTGFGIVGNPCNEGTSNLYTLGGATGWLTTTAPVVPGSIIQLDFAIWDQSDTTRDSSVLIDNFRWEAGPVETGTSRPPR